MKYSKGYYTITDYNLINYLKLNSKLNTELQLNFISEAIANFQVSGSTYLFF